MEFFSYSIHLGLKTHESEKTVFFILYQVVKLLYILYFFYLFKFFCHIIGLLFSKILHLFTVFLPYFPNHHPHYISHHLLVKIIFLWFFCQFIKIDYIYLYNLIHNYLVPFPVPTLIPELLISKWINCLIPQLFYRHWVLPSIRFKANLRILHTIQSSKK